MGNTERKKIAAIFVKSGNVIPQMDLTIDLILLLSGNSIVMHVENSSKKKRNISLS